MAIQGWFRTNFLRFLYYLTGTTLYDFKIQASDYESRNGTKTLQSFFDNSLPLIRHPEVKSWALDLEVERAQRELS